MALMVAPGRAVRAVWFTVAGIALLCLPARRQRRRGRRAAVMGSLAVIAWLTGATPGWSQPGRSHNALMTLLNPLALWDVGLQLSSAATAGLMLVAPGMIGGFRRLLAGLHMEASRAGRSAHSSKADGHTRPPTSRHCHSSSSTLGDSASSACSPTCSSYRRSPPFMLAGSGGVVWAWPG